VVTLSVAFSSALYVALFVAAPTLARTLHAPDATPMLRVLGLSVVVDGLTCVPMALLTRQFAQRTRMVIDFVNFLATTVLTLALAVLGFGAMSFAWGSLAGHAVVVIGCAIAAPGMMRPGWNRGQARRLLVFGLPLAGASLLYVGMLYVDNIVVGAVLGPVALGFYVQAFNLSSFPVNTFSTVVRRVSLAAFSRLATDAAARRDAVGRSLALLAAATFPVAVLLGMLALPLITTLYGAKWAPAAGALGFLAVVGAARVLNELAYDFLVACGHSRVTLYLQALWVAGLLPALTIGAHLDGIRGAAAAHAIVSAGVIVPAFGLAVVRAGVPGMVLLRALVRPLAGATLMAGALLVIRAGTEPGWWQLILGGLVSMAIYLPVVAPLRHLARSFVRPASTGGRHRTPQAA
jgi:O-antigen/teichoic acid export membrane protein